MKRMYPIQGKSKAKRIAWGPTQNYISWAYMKELRENHPCQMFDCNPYVEVYRFRELPIRNYVPPYENSFQFIPLYFFKIRKIFTLKLTKTLGNIV